MAEERNAVGNSNETAGIKNEIERTRVEMSETLGEIQERLRPDHLLQQARDGVKEAAAGKARSIMNSAGETAATVAYQARGVEIRGDYVRQHPFRSRSVGFTFLMLRTAESNAVRTLHVVGRGTRCRFGAPTCAAAFASARDTWGRLTARESWRVSSTARERS